MRVISGRFKGRRLKAAPPAGIRPTSDKLKETVFNILGGGVDGATFFDGCAGTGGIGIEALSRGAALVVFADRSPKSSRSIRENLRSLDIQEGYKIMQMDLGRALDVCMAEELQFDLAFVDPPWDRDDLYETALQKFSGSPLLKAGALLIIEHSKRRNLPESRGAMRKFRSLVQGDSALAFYRSEV